MALRTLSLQRQALNDIRARGFRNERVTLHDSSPDYDVEATNADGDVAIVEVRYQRSGSDSYGKIASVTTTIARA